MMMIIISISIGKWYMHVLWILWSSWVFYSANQGGPRNMVQGTTRWSCAFWRMLVWMKFHITMMVCKRAKMANWQLFSKLAGQFAHEDWQIGNPKKVNTVSVCRLLWVGKHLKPYIPDSKWIHPACNRNVIYIFILLLQDDKSLCLLELISTYWEQFGQQRIESGSSFGWSDFTLF